MSAAGADSGPPGSGAGSSRPGSGPVLAVRVILSWMTILPVGIVPIPDRALAARAITALPVVGVVCGAVCAAVAFGAHTLGATPLLAAALALLSTVLLTRGMHADAVADTADAFGSYAESKRALEIMHSGTVGPMGATSLVFVYLVQAAALAQVIDAGGAVAVVATFVLARCLPIVMCRRGVPAATMSGFGAIVADSQGRAALGLAVSVSIVAGAALAVDTPGSMQVTPLWTMMAGAAVGLLLCLAAVGAGRHVVRRLGGITGDVLGAAIEIAVATGLVAAALLVTAM